MVERLKGLLSPAPFFLFFNILEEPLIYSQLLPEASDLVVAGRSIASRFRRVLVASQLARQLW